MQRITPKPSPVLTLARKRGLGIDELHVLKIRADGSALVAWRNWPDQCIPDTCHVSSLDAARELAQTLHLDGILL